MTLDNSKIFHKCNPSIQLIGLVVAEEAVAEIVAQIVVVVAIAVRTPLTTAHEQHDSSE